MIAIGAALLLIYYSKNPGQGSSGAGRAKHVQATVMPEKHYKKSEDGKVVYLFDDARASDEDSGSLSDVDDPASESPEDPGRPGSAPGAEEKPTDPAPGNGVNGDGRE
jgi:hypothetical protein